MFLFIVVFSSKEQSNQNIIYGDWAGKIENNNIFLTFNKDQTCQFFIDQDSSIIKGNFEIDFSKTPIPLSINNISNLDYNIYTILEFKNKNELKLGKFAKRWRLRPIAFDPNNHLILKKRNQ